MIEDYVRDVQVLRCLRASGLESVLCDLVQYLRGRGHAARVIEDYVRIVGHFAYWLKQKGISLPQLGNYAARRFLEEHLPGCHCRVPAGSARRAQAGIRHLMTMLHHGGYILPTEDNPPNSLESFIEAFEGHLRSTHGAAAETCRLYVRYVRRFLQAVYGDGPIDSTGLKPEQLIEFVAEQAAQGKAQTAKSIVTALRACLRFMVLQGGCPERLLAAVPTVPVHRFTGLPQSLTEAELAHFLQAFDRQSAVGQRDYAMALCLARWGLRAGEVAALTLDDVDWRAATVVIRMSKSRRVNRLPLPRELGQAMVSYLRNARPASATRQLFVRHSTPLGAPITSQVVQAAIRRAFARTGVSGGTHRLRHTAATQMVQAGVSLKAVADILGHRHIDTTFIYAKVDVPSLAGVAMPWPQEVLP